MCDTMVAMGEVSRNGRVYFAKNSDRQPNEPHIMIQVPRQQYPPGARVRCTYLEIEQARETYAVLLLKPSWIWGWKWAAMNLASILVTKQFLPVRNMNPPV